MGDKYRNRFAPELFEDLGDRGAVVVLTALRATKNHSGGGDRTPGHPAEVSDGAPACA